MGFKHKRAERVFDVTAPSPDALLRPEGEVAAIPAGSTSAFHLIDTTMMYAPRSGGVKRYLTAKRAWLETRRPDISHTLVVPGAVTRAEAQGLYTISAAKLPFGDGYRMPASPTRTSSRPATSSCPATPPWTPGKSSGSRWSASATPTRRRWRPSIWASGPSSRP
jgi:hypothetical protein